MTDSAPLWKKAPSGDRPTPPAPAVGGYDVYSRLCPTRLVLDRIADKWSMLVLGRLRQGPRRFNALRREVDGVSQKVLSQTLKALERDGLVARRAFPTVPVTVEYSATPLGLTLGEVVAAVGRWAEANIEEVTTAQRLFDEGRAVPGTPHASRATT